ncbi:MAG: hypothetical protein AB1650_07125 [Candidatus Omnitrophota bacterium]
MISLTKENPLTLKHLRKKAAISFFTAISFITNVIIPPVCFAQGVSVLNLPLPGTMISSSMAYAPMTIKGINIHPDNPLMFDFIIEEGDSNLQNEQFTNEAQKLVKYFLASLTVPQEQMWVNLSPYEKDRIIPTTFGQTEMGRDLLAQDYLLKQLSASLMHPENKSGKEFWQRLRQRAKEEFGSSEIPMDTFNKIWIVPETAKIYEHAKGAFVVESRLKVMLEEDYLAMEANQGRTNHGIGDVGKEELRSSKDITLPVVREILIPEIEREVNEGKIFANLRQIHNAMVLAKWYKEHLRESLLGQVYVDQGKTEGVNVADPEINQKIYEQYVAAFKKGVFDFIKEDYDESSREVIPRKYFSGGYAGDKAQLAKVNNFDPRQADGKYRVVTVKTPGMGDPAMLSEIYDEEWIRKVPSRKDMVDQLRLLYKIVNDITRGDTDDLLSLLMHFPLGALNDFSAETQGIIDQFLRASLLNFFVYRMGEKRDMVVSFYKDEPFLYSSKEDPLRGVAQEQLDNLIGTLFETDEIKQKEIITSPDDLTPGSVYLLENRGGKQGAFFFDGGYLGENLEWVINSRPRLIAEFNQEKTDEFRKALAGWGWEEYLPGKWLLYGKPLTGGDIETKGSAMSGRNQGAEQQLMLKGDSAMLADLKGELRIKLNPEKHRELGVDPNGIAWGEMPLDPSDKETARIISNLVQAAGLPVEDDGRKLGPEGAKLLISVNTQSGRPMVPGLILDRGYIIQFVEFPVDYSDYLTLKLLDGYSLISFDSDTHIIKISANSMRFDPQEDGTVSLLVKLQGNESMNQKTLPRKQDREHDSAMLTEKFGNAVIVSLDSERIKTFFNIYGEPEIESRINHEEGVRKLKVLNWGQFGLFITLRNKNIYPGSSTKKVTEVLVEDHRRTVLAKIWLDDTKFVESAPNVIGEFLNALSDQAMLAEGDKVFINKTQVRRQDAIEAVRLFAGFVDKRLSLRSKKKSLFPPRYITLFNTEDYPSLEDSQEFTVMELLVDEFNAGKDLLVIKVQEPESPPAEFEDLFDGLTKRKVFFLVSALSRLNYKRYTVPFNDTLEQFSAFLKQKETDLLAGEDLVEKDSAMLGMNQETEQQLKLEVLQRFQDAWNSDTLGRYNTSGKIFWIEKGEKSIGVHVHLEISDGQEEDFKSWGRMSFPVNTVLEQNWVNISISRSLLEDNLEEGIRILLNYINQQNSFNWEEEKIDRMTKEIAADGAMIGKDNKVNGGIDFNPDMSELTIQKDGQGFQMPVMSADDVQRYMDVKGFMPVIINVAPVQSLPLILGYADEDAKDNEQAKQI